VSRPIGVGSYFGNMPTPIPFQGGLRSLARWRTSSGSPGARTKRRGARRALYETSRNTSSLIAPWTRHRGHPGRPRRPRPRQCTRLLTRARTRARHAAVGVRLESLTYGSGRRPWGMPRTSGTTGEIRMIPRTVRTGTRFSCPRPKWPAEMGHHAPGRGARRGLCQLGSVIGDGGACTPSTPLRASSGGRRGSVAVPGTAGRGLEVPRWVSPDRPVATGV
jgi:hypothetical protein